MKEIQNIVMWNPEQFAKLVKDNKGKYIFMNIQGSNSNRYSRYGQNLAMRFDALAVFEGIGPVSVTLDMERCVPWPFELQSERTGKLHFGTQTKKDLVEALKAAGVDMENVKKLKKLTLKEMFNITDNSEPDPEFGQEDNFEKIIKGSVDKNVVEFESPLGKVSMKVDRNGRDNLAFTVSIDWKTGLEKMIADVKKALTDCGLELQEGKLG